MRREKERRWEMEAARSRMVSAVGAEQAAVVVVIVVVRSLFMESAAEPSGLNADSTLREMVEGAVSLSLTSI